MRLLLLLAGVLLLAGCPLPGGDTEDDVDPSKIVVTRTGPATISVMGQAGAVTPGAATTVTLTVNRAIYPSPTPTPPSDLPIVGFRVEQAEPTPTVAGPLPRPRYQLLHLGAHLPVYASYAVLNPDGSFAAVPLGDAYYVIEAGDELDLTPQQGDSQIGYTIYVVLP